MAAISLPTSDRPEDWAASGRNLAPVARLGKTILTAHGFKDATTDTAQLRAWAEEYPGCNWACCPGMGGECVLDFDPFHANEPARALLERYCDTTASVLSPTYGVHVWFTLPAGVHLGNGRGCLPPGWDVRAHNGHVLIPGSMVRYLGEAAAKKGVQHGFTGRYVVLRAGPIVELPEAVLALILQPRGKTMTNEAHTPATPYRAYAPGPPKSPPLTDAGVLAVCRGLPSGVKFQHLWAGDATGYQSTSEAVKALVNLLTFVTQDVNQVDRLFKQSDLHPLYARWCRLSEREIAESLATRRSWWRGRREHDHGKWHE